MRCFYNSTAWLIGVVGILYLLSDYANASASEEKAKQAAALNYRAYAIKAEKQRDELLAALSFYLTSWDGCSRCGSRLTPEITGATLAARPVD